MSGFASDSNSRGRIGAGRSPKKRVTSRPRRFRPALEALEDRLAPAVTVADTAQLRAALAAPPADTVILLQPGTYNTQADGGGTFAINSSVKLEAASGGSAANVFVDGNKTDGVFDVVGAVTAEFDGLTIQNGNTGGDGAGIDAAGGGTLVLNNSVVRTSQAGGNGGGIAVTGGSLTVNSSVINNNTTSNGEGGGIESSAGAAATIAITNSTISGNTAGNGFNGGGIAVDGTGALSLTNATITLNSAGSFGGGVYNGAGTVTLRNTLVAGNGAGFAGPDLSGGFTSQGNNLVGDGTGSAGLTNGVNGDQVGSSGNPINPGLDPRGLQNNGGPTQTVALLPGSPAIDAGQDGVVATDQRGVSRPQGLHTDIGAFEFVPGSVVQGLTGVATVAGNEFTPLTNVPVAIFTVPGGLVNPASLSATINWGDNTAATTGVITQSGSTYTVSGSHTYAEHAVYRIATTIAGYGGGPAVSRGVIGEELLPGQNTAGAFDQRLVAEIFRDLSGHGIDAFSLAVWTTVLDNTTAALDQAYLAAGLNSDQALALAFSQAVGGVTRFIEIEVGFQPPAGTPQQMLSANYQQMLDRPLDAAGANFYLPLFNEGFTDQQIVPFIVGALTFEYAVKVG